MINWKIREEDGVVSIDIVGHAGYAKNGQDIVCASVSTLLYFFVNCVQTLDEDSIKYIHLNSGDAKIKLDGNEKIKPLLEVFQLMLREVERQFPAYLKELTEND